MNYRPEDLRALVDFVGMIKGSVFISPNIFRLSFFDVCCVFVFRLGVIFRKSEPVLSPLLRRVIHDSLQDFVQSQLTRPLRKAFKAKKNILDVMLKVSGGFSLFLFCKVT